MIGYVTRRVVGALAVAAAFWLIANLGGSARAEEDSSSIGTTPAGDAYNLEWELWPGRPVGTSAQWLLSAPFPGPPVQLRAHFCLSLPAGDSLDPDCQGARVDSRTMDQFDHETSSGLVVRSYDVSLVRNPADPAQHVRFLVVTTAVLTSEGVEQVPLAWWEVPNLPAVQTAAAADGDTSAFDLAGDAGAAYGGAVAVGGLLGLGLCLFAAMRG